MEAGRGHCRASRQLGKFSGPHLCSHLLKCVGCSWAVDYQDETELFYADPFHFLRTRFSETIDASFPPTVSSTLPNEPPNVYVWPSHLVVFDELLKRKNAKTGERMDEVLRGIGYRIERRFWNSIVHEEPRRSGDIVVLRHFSLM